MRIENIDFIDEDLEETIKGYLIIDDDEIIVIYEGYNTLGGKRFENIEEIVQELLHTREMLRITEEMLDEEIEKSKDLEEIISDFFEE